MNPLKEERKNPPAARTDGISWETVVSLDPWYQIFCGHIDHGMPIPSPIPPLDIPTDTFAVVLDL